MAKSISKKNKIEQRGTYFERTDGECDGCHRCEGWGRMVGALLKDEELKEMIIANARDKEKEDYTAIG